MACQTQTIGLAKVRQPLIILRKPDANSQFQLLSLHRPSFVTCAPGLYTQQGEDPSVSARKSEDYPEGSLANP